MLSTKLALSLVDIFSTRNYQTMVTNFPILRARIPDNVVVTYQFRIEANLGFRFETTTNRLQFIYPWTSRWRWLAGRLIC